jgi:hypothetical protein
MLMNCGQGWLCFPDLEGDHPIDKSHRPNLRPTAGRAGRAPVSLFLLWSNGLRKGLRRIDKE